MKFTPLSTAALVFSLAASPGQAGAAPHPVRLGETAYVGGPRIRPLRVIEDSRCPMNARCVSAGRIILRARVSGHRWSRIMDLTLGEPTHIADGKLTLTSVTPDRVAGQRFETRRLHFGFDFQGGV